MKTRTLLATALIAGLCHCMAEAEDIQLPDLGKAFPEEKVMHNLKVAGASTCAYATDLGFEELKKKLQEFLGEGWSEEKLDGAAEQAMNKVFEAQGMKVLGIARYTNAKLQDAALVLSQIEMPVEGKKTMAQLVISSVPNRVAAPDAE